MSSYFASKAIKFTNNDGVVVIDEAAPFNDAEFARRVEVKREQVRLELQKKKREIRKQRDALKRAQLLVDDIQDVVFD
jgi:hypothetical protein